MNQNSLYITHISHLSHIYHTPWFGMHWHWHKSMPFLCETDRASMNREIGANLSTSSGDRITARGVRATNKERRGGGFWRRRRPAHRGSRAATGGRGRAVMGAAAGGDSGGRPRGTRRAWPGRRRRTRRSPS